MKSINIYWLKVLTNQKWIIEETRLFLSGTCKGLCNTCTKVGDIKICITICQINIFVSCKTRFAFHIYFWTIVSKSRWIKITLSGTLFSWRIIESSYLPRWPTVWVCLGRYQKWNNWAVLLCSCGIAGGYYLFFILVQERIKTLLYRALAKTHGSLVLMDFIYREIRYPISTSFTLFRSKSINYYHFPYISNSSVKEMVYMRWFLLSVETRQISTTAYQGWVFLYFLLWFLDLKAENRLYFFISFHNTKHSVQHIVDALHIFVN